MANRGRGHWDRGLSSDDRRAAQRARILEATARASAAHGRALTLSDVVLLAGVGRNTFYEHFEDIDAAIVASVAEGVEGTARGLARAAETARTPIERLRTMARAWIESAAELPGLVESFRRDAGRGPGKAGQAFESTGLDEALRAVITDARAAGTIGRGPEPMRLHCVVGAFEAAARLVTAAPGSSHREELADVLVDVTLRAFR